MNTPRLGHTRVPSLFSRKARTDAKAQDERAAAAMPTQDQRDPQGEHAAAAQGQRDPQGERAAVAQGERVAAAQGQRDPQGERATATAATPAQDQHDPQGETSHSTASQPACVPREVLLQADNISFAYKADKPVLQDVSLLLTAGTFTGILGVNGCGKSTLLNILDGALTPLSGRVLLQGQPLESYSRTRRAQIVSYVVQHSHAGHMSVYDALLLGRKPHMGPLVTNEDKLMVERVLVDLGMEDFALRSTDELSGGEYQKMMIGRALVQEANIILLDEPTNNLDLANTNEVLRQVAQISHNQGRAACAVLHDVNAALRFCDKLVVLGKDGAVYRSGGPEIITEELMYNVYGVHADCIECNGTKAVIVH